MEDDNDLYEYYAGHTGSRSYVSVRGHIRSVPRYKTYKGSDGRNYIHPDFGGDWSGAGNGSFTYLPDKQAYLSPLDGTMVTSRSQHREHMLKHGVIEAGDMPVGHMGRNQDRSPMERAGRTVADVLRKEGYIG